MRLRAWHHDLLVLTGNRSNTPADNRQSAWCLTYERRGVESFIDDQQDRHNAVLKLRRTKASSSESRLCQDNCCIATATLTQIARRWLVQQMRTIGGGKKLPAKPWRLFQQTRTLFCTNFNLNQPPQPKSAELTARIRSIALHANPWHSLFAHAKSIDPASFRCLMHREKS